MKKDIVFPEMKGLAVAIVPTEEADTGWWVYLVNMEDRLLETVLVTSRGYGTLDGRKKETSVMRHQVGDIAGQKAVPIEGILEEVFQLTNAFWVSYWEKGKLFDKKFVFVPGSIHPDNFTEIPFLGKEGVMIQ